MILSTKLVAIIERNADQLSRRWIELVRRDEATPTYHEYDEDKLYRRVYSVYSQLGRWLSAESTGEEVARLYTELGRQRHKEGFRLSEVLQALILTRRVLWSKIQMDGLFETALDLNQVLDLRSRTIRFFDRAMVCTAQGYESV